MKTSSALAWEISSGIGCIISPTEEWADTDVVLGCNGKASSQAICMLLQEVVDCAYP